MKGSVAVSTLVGVSAVVIAETLQGFHIVLQTDPGEYDPTIVPTSIILLVAGVSMLSAAYVDWKQKVSPAMAIGIFLLGSVGFALSFQFHNAIVAAFFPRTYVSAFLGTNFSAIALAGVLLPIMGRSLKRAKPDITDVASRVC
jgi:predicted tellurium resistance membrane protein TerC